MAPPRKRAVRGVDQTLKNLRRISDVVARGPALDRAARAGLAPMHEEAVTNARRLRQPETPDGVHLDQGIVIDKRPSRRRGFRTYWIGLEGRARRIGHLAEFGTAPHWQPRRRWQHPGAVPKPWLRPAYEMKRNEVGLIVGRALWPSIEAAILRDRR